MSPKDTEQTTHSAEFGSAHCKSSGQAIKCAIYTRKSTQEGLDEDFTTLDAQRESAEQIKVSVTFMPLGSMAAEG